LALLGPVTRYAVAPLSGEERTLSGRINQADL
jgi:hypothetical protein